MTNYHPEYKPGCKLANARIAEMEAESAELRKQNEILATSRRLEEAERKQAEADNRILTTELRIYFQQYGWESTERILRYHGAERSTT